MWFTIIQGRLQWNGTFLALFWCYLCQTVLPRKNRFSGILKNASILLYNKTFCYIGIKVKSIGQKNNRTTSTQFNDHQLAANKTINYIIWMRECNNENEKNEWFDHDNNLCIFNNLNWVSNTSFSILSIIRRIRK